MKLEGSEEINDAISCYEFYKIAGNMWNATFTAKGDHIAWTQVEQFTSKSSCNGFFFFLQRFGICILSASM